MWISFPVTRHVRIIIPWLLVPLVVPLAVAGWILSLTIALIRRVWQRPRGLDQRDDRVTIRNTVTRP